MSDANQRRDHWIALVLATLTFLSRIPFRSHILYHWDSVNFTYAMREFNVAQEQPHSPGYILYVWLCRLVDLLFGDAQATMVWISILASALAVAALFYLGRALLNRQTGLLAALFLASAPLFWFYGEIALPHSLDTLFVIVGTWWLYETMRGRQRYLYPAIIILAIAGGVRQQTLIFLVPLLLFALRQVGWKRFFIAGALGGVICLLWFVPLMTSSGGIDAYLETVQVYTDRFNVHTSVFMGAGWPGVWRNLRRLVMYTLYGWGVALLPFAAYVVALVWRREWPRNKEKAVFFALWLVPTLFFYTFIHMGQQGLIFLFLPALLLWGAHSLTCLARAMPRRALGAIAAVLLTINVGIFCLGPEHPLGDDNLRLLTRATLVNSDHYYQDRFAAIEKHFSIQSTAILAANWHHVEYYLPRYQIIPVTLASRWGQNAGQMDSTQGAEQRISVPDLDLTPDAGGRVQIVIFDEALRPFIETPQFAHSLVLEHGGQIDILTLATDQALYHGQNIGIAPGQTEE